MLTILGGNSWLLSSKDLRTGSVGGGVVHSAIIEFQGLPISYASYTPGGRSQSGFLYPVLALGLGNNYLNHEPNYDVAIAPWLTDYHRVFSPDGGLYFDRQTSI
ncbi:MAG: hypothetical protein QS721_03710 [Candidatus Endonucleobacter sp. (ex Gigantidas childressi)]|nr:hypothetical protein [Candidatus Endonucleobacter sp. (ex Gigantidas childressi)]